MDADEPDEVRELQEMAARLEKMGMNEQAEAVSARVNEILQKRGREVRDVAKAKKVLDGAHGHLNRCRR
eukprot:9656686-Alexandrium_andersonii.AAC.1